MGQYSLGRDAFGLAIYQEAKRNIMLYPGFVSRKQRFVSTRDAGLQRYHEGTLWGGRTAANVVIYVHA
jgi:hypothetical protein